MADAERGHGHQEVVGGRALFVPAGTALEKVTLTFPIWNLISEWLERLEALRQAR